MHSVLGADSRSMTPAECLHEYQRSRALLDQAIAVAERTYERLVTRLVELDREATRSGDQLRRPLWTRERAQRSAATISVAQATAS